MPAPPNPSILPSLALVLAMSAVLAGMLLVWHAALTRLSRREPLVPLRPPRWVPWRGAAVLVTVVLYVLISHAVSVGFLIATGQAELKSPAVQLGAMAIINASLLLLLPPLIRLLSDARLADLGIARVSWTDLRLGACGCLLAAAPTYILFSMATRIWPPRGHPMERMIADEAGPGVTLLAIVSGVLLAPMAEELVFRGVLQGWLTRLFARRVPAPDPDGSEVVVLVPGLPTTPEAGGAEESFWVAPRAAVAGPAAPAGPGPVAGWMPNLITSFLFAALHWGQWPAPIPLFALSLALGWLADRTGGIVAPIAMHATFNGLSTAMLLLVTWAGFGGPPPREVVPPAKVAEISPTNPPWRRRVNTVDFRTLSHLPAITLSSPMLADGIGIRNSAVFATGRLTSTSGPQSVDESRPPVAP